MFNISFGGQKHKKGAIARQSVEDLVRLYLDAQEVGLSQLAALEKMAGNNADDLRRIEILRDAMADGSVQYIVPGSSSRRSC